MSYNANSPADITVTLSTADIRENFRAIKEDKIVAAGSAAIADSATTAAACTGNAATATKLATARNINGVAFDGSTDITITAKSRPTRTIISSQTAQTISQGVKTYINFDTIISDNVNGFDSAQPTKITIKEDGLYSLCGNVRWQSGKNNQCGAAICLNGSIIAISVLANSETGSSAGNSCSICYPLKANDYIQISAWQAVVSPTLQTNPSAGVINLSVVKIGDI